VWALEAPIESAFDALRDYERHPMWWHHVRSVQRAPESPASVRYEIRSPLAYSLVFEVALERVERPHLLVTRASGDLLGTGEWRLTQENGVTRMRYRWDVSTTKTWMNAVTPLARPAFRWAHDRVMDGGAHGLATFLDARLVEAR
jgi:uncharacterized protein YndB with AHSA1/START domain